MTFHTGIIFELENFTFSVFRIPSESVSKSSTPPPTPSPADGYSLISISPSASPDAYSDFLLISWASQAHYSDNNSAGTREPTTKGRSRKREFKLEVWVLHLSLTDETLSEGARESYTDFFSKSQISSRWEHISRTWWIGEKLSVGAICCDSDSESSLSIALRETSRYGGNQETPARLSQLPTIFLVGHSKQDISTLGRSQMKFWNMYATIEAGSEDPTLVVSCRFLNDL